MRNTRTRRALGAILGVLALGALAGPAAAAGAPDHWTSTDSWVVQHECGVVETTTVTLRGRSYFEDGEWVRDAIQFDFYGVYVGPTGKTYTNDTHQNGTFTAETGALSGQGVFLRGGGRPSLMDVGRLVFQFPDANTLMSSAKAVPFGDPVAAATLEAALCAKLG